MKRGNDNSQLRAEEVESLNDEESEERGSFQRASADVLASRKIFKSKRSSDSSSSLPTSSSSFGNGLPTQPKLNTSFTSSVSAPANPFSGFSGLVSKPAEVAAANPFSGFQGLSNNTLKPLEQPSTVSNAFGFVPTTNATATTNAFGVSAFGQNKPTTISSSTGFAFTSSNSTAPSTVTSSTNKNGSELNSVSTSEGEYKKKMRKLNNSFLNWANRQIIEHPLSIWKDGVKDYIKYTSDLNAKYGAGDGGISLSNFTKVAKDSAPVPIVAKAVPAPAPAPAAVTFGGFGSAPLMGTTAATVSAPAPAPTSFSITPAPIVFGAPANTASSTASFKDTFAFAAPPTVKPVDAPAPFSFGAASAAPTGGSFSSSFAFPSAAPTTSTVPGSNGFGGFGSGFPPLPAVASSFSLGNNSFSFAPPPAVGLASTAAATAGGEDEGGDDEGEPILEPEKVLRDANDTDTILLDVPCKLYGYSKAGNEWKDTGKGSFRVTRSADSNKQRMLVRNPIGKLTFNAGFYKGMKMEKVKGGVRFSAFVVTDEPSIGGAAPVAPKPELKGFMVKMKEADIANALTILEAGVASCE